VAKNESRNKNKNVTRNVIQIVTDDSRRLTGPNLLSDYPGAVLEVFLKNISPERVVEQWQKHLSQLLKELNLQCEFYSRCFEDGANIGFRADEDMLYAACEINEAAVELARAELTDRLPELTLTDLERLRSIISEERNPKLMALIKSANAHQVSYLTDDDEFSLGTGKSCQVWPISELPNVESIVWKQYKNIPVAFITGTNGKSTSVRMCDSIIKAGGISAGVTSTDYIRAADVILDRGDYSGPGGARTLLRDQRVELALLEVARGGMLRRGIGTNKAKAALITNVADDHLGQYGINTVKALIAVKAVVARSLSEDGTLVVNADDAGLVEYFDHHPELIRGQIAWFSLDANHPKIIEQQQKHQMCAWLENDQINYFESGKSTAIIKVNDIPTTMNGAAKHNIANSLGATILCRALGSSVDEITEGLATFKGDNKDNPGRGNYFNLNGVTILVDFAHNAHSLTAVIDTVSAMPAKRRLIMLGHAGDRTDRDIINLTDVATRLNPDVVVTAELSDYLRGRELGEVPALIEARLTSESNPPEVIYAKDCLSGAKLAMKWAEPGDFVLLLALDQRDAIFEYLDSLSR